MPETISLVPGPEERALFLGQNGSGKSLGALSLLIPIIGKKPIYIFDTKGEQHFDKLTRQLGENVASMHDRFRDVAKAETPVIIYRPDGREMADLDFIDRTNQWVYDRRNCLVLYDEVSQVTGGQVNPKPGFLNVYTRGRSRGIAVWANSQRPAYVPKVVYTEARRFYVYFLADVNDRKKVSGFTHPGLMTTPTRKYGFMYFAPGMANPLEFGPMRLRKEVA